MVGRSTRKASLSSNDGSMDCSGQSNSNDVIKRRCFQKIMFVKDGLVSCTNLKIIKLPHPRLGTSAMFVIDQEKNQLYELNAFDEGFRSWFIEENVMSDGCIYISTPVDVTYLILPLLMETKQNLPLDHLLENSEYLSMYDLSHHVTDLSHVADSKGDRELNIWCYNELSTMKWLEKRVKRLSKVIQTKNIPLISNLPYQRTFNEQHEKDAYLTMAHGIISDYLDESLSTKLYKHLNLPDITTIKQKATEAPENSPVNKKIKLEVPVEDYSIKSSTTGKVKITNSAKSKALAKSASGTKSIMSFFNKK